MRAQLFAELMLDASRPLASGQRLMVWAAACQLDGVIVPGALYQELRAEVGSASNLRCLAAVDEHLHLWPRAADGLVLRDPIWTTELIAGLKRAAVPVFVVLKSLDPSAMRELEGVHVTWIHDTSDTSFAEWSALMAYAHAHHFSVGATDQRHDRLMAMRSVASGASVLLKGLTLDCSIGGATCGGSLYPDQWASLVRLVKNNPFPVSADLEQLAATESLVAARALPAGHRLTQSDLKIVPSLHGLTTAVASAVLGSELLYACHQEEPITFGLVRPWAGRSNGVPLDVTVVIRTKNEVEWLRRSLPALLHQQRPPKEIIIVDNESTDDTRKVAESFNLRTLTISDREFTYGRALNQGIAKCETSWVAILSAHCIPLHDRWLEALWAHASEAPFLAAVYGRQEPLPDTSDFDKRDLWTTFGSHRRRQRGSDFFFHNANSFISRAVWERLPFDESLNGVEDRDWAKQVLADGCYITYEPLASVHHYHGIHQGRDEHRAKRVVKVIEMIHRQRHPQPAPPTALRPAVEVPREEPLPL